MLYIYIYTNTYCISLTLLHPPPVIPSPAVAKWALLGTLSHCHVVPRDC